MKTPNGDGPCGKSPVLAAFHRRMVLPVSSLA